METSVNSYTKKLGPPISKQPLKYHPMVTTEKHHNRQRRKVKMMSRGKDSESENDGGEDEHPVETIRKKQEEK